MVRNPRVKSIIGGLFITKVPIRFISVKIIIGILKNSQPRSLQFMIDGENMEVWICLGNIGNLLL